MSAAIVGSGVVSSLVSPEWLHDNLDNPGIQVIETAGIPDSYLKAHIRGAICLPCHPHLKRFDQNEEKTQYVMDTAEFTDLCCGLGLRRDKHYILYDDMHGLFAARFWAVCRYYGVDNISILDGSWHGWLERGLPITTEIIEPTAGSNIVAQVRPSLFIGLEEMQRLHREPDVQLWDTRRGGEYDGQEETDNRRRGHIPGALHLSWTDLLTDEDVEGLPRYLKPRAEMESLLAGLGLQRDKTIVTYCQSGIRAAFCLLVLERLGFAEHRLYDASMGEWCNRDETPLTSEAT